MRSIINAIPLIVLWFIILDENIFMSLIKNQGFRVPLFIVVIAASISWSYEVLKKLRLYTKAFRIRLIPSRLVVSIVFFTLLLVAKAIYSWQTSNWRLFVGGAFFTIFYFLIFWKRIYSRPEEKAES
ncbi:MAG: hypothetical protein ACUVQ0_06240 [Thermoproteota archaeon]